MQVFDLKNSFHAALSFEGDAVEYQDCYYLRLKYYLNDTDNMASIGDYISQNEAENIIKGAKKLIRALEHGLPIEGV